MSSPFDDSPEDLVRLRTTVKDWLEKSQIALETFYRDDKSFWLNERPQVRPATRSTGRSSSAHRHHSGIHSRLEVEFP